MLICESKVRLNSGACVNSIANSLFTTSNSLYGKDLLWSCEPHFYTLSFRFWVLFLPHKLHLWDPFASFSKSSILEIISSDNNTSLIMQSNSLVRFRLLQSPYIFLNWIVVFKNVWGGLCCLNNEFINVVSNSRFFKKTTWLGSMSAGRDEASKHL